jgi:hypothetical protein
MLRSLMSSFRDNPHQGLILPIVLLIGLNPAPLAADLMEFVKSNGLNALLLAVGPELLASKHVPQAEPFVAEALKVIHTRTATMAESEFACGILSAQLDQLDGDVRASLVQRIRDNMLDDYPSHIQRLVF